MDFINEQELYEKVVAPAIIGLSQTLRIAIEQTRADLDGAQIIMTIPETKLKFDIRIPKKDA